MTPLALGLGGPYDIAIIAGVVLLLFGGSKLAGFGKSVGSGIKEFKSAVKDEEQSVGDAGPPMPLKQSDAT
jgi:sec-independent protein translocase protein TatA